MFEPHQEPRDALAVLLQLCEPLWRLEHLRHDGLVSKGPHGQNVAVLLQRQAHEAWRLHKSSRVHNSHTFVRTYIAHVAPWSGKATLLTGSQSNALSNALSSAFQCISSLLSTTDKDGHILVLSQAITNEWLGAFKGTSHSAVKKNKPFEHQRY